MTLLVSATWRRPDGTLSGAYRPSVDPTELDAVLLHLEDVSRRSQGSDFLVSVMDDITGHVTSRMRPRR